jgi:transcriptional activator SPT7
MKRVRHTHARFASLIANTAALGGTDESIDGLPPTTGAAAGFPSQSGITMSSNLGGGLGGATAEEENVDVVNDRVDERPWLQHYIDAAQSHEDAVPAAQLANASNSVTESARQKVRKKGKRKKRSRLPTGIDMGEEIADGCVRWMEEKVLDHVGFQGGLMTFW